MGLTYFKRYRMELDLRQPLYEPVPLPNNYRLATWSDHLLPEHAEAKYRSFFVEVDANVFPCLGDREGCYRLMSEITRRPTFLPSATWLLVHQTGDASEPCGTVQGIADRDRFGAIQNLGIVPEHRGRGLGSLLLHSALCGFRAAGLPRATLEVTAQNSGALRLYHRLGFRKVRTVYKAVDVAMV